jgi:hypothetical protein
MSMPLMAYVHTGVYESWPIGSKAESGHTERHGGDLLSVLTSLRKQNVLKILCFKYRN